MKTHHFIPTHLSPARRWPRGFALIVTLSLMILLTVIAVGLLSLSSITLRASSQGSAMASARANARLALMMALGDLQKHAGPDQRVSARADILTASSKKPRLTGIWDSWEIKPTTVASDFDKSARDLKFRGWLTSGSPAEMKEISFANTDPLSLASPGAGKSPLAVNLWDKGTVGDPLPATTPPTPSGIVTINKIPLVSPPGAVAWAVMDEGVKVRINTRYADNATANGPKTAALGAGERPGVEFIPGLNGLDRTFFEKGATASALLEKGISRLNFSLAGEQLAPGVRAALKPLTHDVTTLSTGLFTDTARGGLKEDFHLLTNAATLPAKYKGLGVYASRTVMPAGGGPSDPQWESLQQFAKIYSDKTKLTKSGVLPVLKATTPSLWKAATTTTVGGKAVTTVNRASPPGLVLLPNIAKVQIVFSLIGRDLYSYPAYKANEVPPLVPETAAKMHNPQDEWFRGTKYDYDLHLLYTPIVSLHNPYNVAIEFTEMKLDFLRVPFAMQVFRSGKAMSTDLVPLETMYGGNKDGAKDKNFGMVLKSKLAGKPNPAGNTPIRLLPGEVKMFSAYLDPALKYSDEVTKYSSGASAWDANFDKNLTAAIDSIPGWRGNGLGFDADQLAGGKVIQNAGAVDGFWQSSIAFARDDNFYIKFAPLSTSGGDHKFTVRMTAKIGSAAAATVTAIEMDYETDAGLQDSILGKGNTLRYPPGNEVISAISLLDHATTPYGALKGAKPFALLSVQAKTTSGARDASILDGRLATKPWAFAHPAVGASSQKVVSEHAANQSHELDLQALESGTDELLSIDPQDRTVFITGHTKNKGTKFGTLYDVPLAPIQTFASLNGANPGGSSGYLPRFAQPIGNSWAHPLITPAKMTEAGPSGYNYLDHSFLINLALYDGFYFSGLADQTGEFGSGKTSATLAADFVAGKSLDDPRMVIRPPSGKAVSDFATAISQTAAYSNIAAWQVMDGAFNINSTSVPAWKAMLASIHDSQALVNKRASASATTTTLATLAPTPTGKARISRMRLPAADDGAEIKDVYWLGAREYSDTELQTLATNIVKQVQIRGPFLSMAEFVNRRLGPESDEKSQRGALQQAIDDSNLNKAIAESATGANAGYEIPPATISADPAKYQYKNLTAGSGSSYQGAPGYLTQADILSVLGNAATPRSDTFTIRGYGETRDAAGKLVATATCEAVVQRAPEWVDAADAVETPVLSLTSNTNKNFGRRFLITSFRWLNSNEI